jgi:hypothetical protein
MLLLGKQITQAGDPLQPYSVEQVYRALINDSGSVAKMKQQLEAIRAVDLSRYRKLKTQLPYLVCGHFQPRVRLKEHFVYTERFFVDLDHLSEQGFDPEILMASLKSDPRIELMFRSPSGDGLKLLFRLKERITDLMYYSQFYKLFCRVWGADRMVQNLVDSKTSDVTRCCFVSHDPDTYYQPNAESIDAFAMLPPGDLDIMVAVADANKQADREQRTERRGDAEQRQEIATDVLNQIKAKMGMRVPNKPVEKEIAQPELLKSVLPALIDRLPEVDASLKAEKLISYGRQLTIQAAANPMIWAEVNLFAGKRGLTVVPTTKTGSHSGFTNLLVEWMKALIQDLMHYGSTEEKGV